MGLQKECYCWMGSRNTRCQSNVTERRRERLFKIIRVGVDLQYEGAFIRARGFPAEIRRVSHHLPPKLFLMMSRHIKIALSQLLVVF